MSSWEEVTDTEAHDKSGELSNRGCSPVSLSGPLTVSRSPYDTSSLPAISNKYLYTVN